MTIELAHWLETELDFRAEFTDTSFLQAQNAVLTGHADVLTSLFYSPKRDQGFDFTEVLFEVPASIFVSSERPDIVTLADLSGKRIAIQRGDYAKEFLEEKGIEFQHIPTLDFAEATAAVIQGRADAIIGDEQIVLYYLFSHGLADQVKKVGEPLYVGLNCMAVKDGNKVLLSILNKGIAFAKQRGVLDRINQKWIGTHFVDPEDYWFRYWPYLAVLVALVLLVIIWNVNLRRAVKLKTRAFQESEKRLRRIFDELSIGMAVWNEKGEFLKINQAFTEIAGYSAEEISQLKFSDITSAEFHTEEARLFKDLVEGVTPNFKIEKQCIHKDGYLFWVGVNANKLHGAEESPSLFIGSLENIDQEKRLAMQIKEREETISLLLNSTAEAIYGLDSFGNCTFCNQSCLDILGYRSDEELLGRNIHEVIHHTTAEGLPNSVGDCQIFKSFQHGEKIHIESDHFWKADGTSFSAEVWSHPIEKDNAIIGAVVTFIDITKQKQTEEKRLKLEDQLRQSQKMEAIGTMAGGIAHDFNNVLAIIGGNLDLLQLNQQAGKPIDENLEHIREASDRAKNLVAQILAFSRQEQKELVPVNLTTFVGESLKFLRPMIPTTVGLMTEAPEDPVQINADTTQLQQVLINLCSNALHAMNEKGLLRISLEEEELTAHETLLALDPQPGRYVKLSVADTGKGMDKKTLDRIFDPFFTTKEVGKGTGMGLSVVHGIIEQFGGFIQVDSTPGQGATFTLYFPATSAVEATEETVAETTLPTGTECILFVDDEQHVAEVGGSMLGHLGYTVTTMTNSVEALELFKTHPDDFDLVITDQTMPKMSGVELSKELLKIKPHIPIILCSGYSAQVTGEDALGIGIRAFCMKPVEMKQLASVARETLDTSRQPSVMDDNDSYNSRLTGPIDGD